MAHLQFPSLVIKLGYLMGGIFLGVQQRRQQCLGPKALALILDAPRQQRLGQLRMLPSRFT